MTQIRPALTSAGVSVVTNRGQDRFPAAPHPEACGAAGLLTPVRHLSPSWTFSTNVCRSSVVLQSCRAVSPKPHHDYWSTFLPRALEHQRARERPGEPLAAGAHRAGSPPSSDHHKRQAPPKSVPVTQDARSSESHKTATRHHYDLYVFILTHTVSTGLGVYVNTL